MGGSDEKKSSVSASFVNCDESKMSISLSPVDSNVAKEKLAWGIDSSALLILFLKSSPEAVQN